MIVTAACGSASDPVSTEWHADLPAYSDEAPLREAVAAALGVSLADDPSIPSACVEGRAADIADVLVADLGVLGLRSRGVTVDDASAVWSDTFYQSLDPDTRTRVVAALARCAGLVGQLVGEVPGVSSSSMTCLIDQVSAAGFFEAGRSPGAAAAFQAARSDCLDQAEQAAYDAWRTARLEAPTPLVLDPVDCAALETAHIEQALGFNIDRFGPSAIKTDAERPVVCAFGNPDGKGPWVLLYVATQDFQRDVYRDYEPTIPEAAETWATLSEVLDYAGVYFITRGGSVEWHGDAVTALFDGGRTAAAATAGEYVVMVSANAGSNAQPLSRADMAGAVAALSKTLALP